MKVLFCGLGSIGQRHLRNLVHIFHERQELLAVHALRSSPVKLSEDISNIVERQFFSLNEVESAYDAIFITNPTYLHYKTLRNMAGKSNKFFIEKPVFHTAEIDFSELGLQLGSICYVAAPLRYTKVFRYLEREIFQHSVYAARAICSSYLPDWRPGTDYRSCYSASKSKGGDVYLDLIHEWDYIVQLFGFPTEVYCMSGRYSKLEIDSDDISLYTARYPDKLVSISLDYFGRKSRREIEIYLENDVIVADYIRQEVRFLQSGKTISLLEDRDDWQRRELEYFLDLWENCRNWNTIQHAMDVLRLAKGECA